ncbi:MAG: phosphoglycerate kinase [Chloroflexi bacterium]|nr:phosphoglycerate kinase [Chloroflexota bacterium]
MNGKKSVKDIDVAGRTVLVRVDFNVPFRPGTREVSDDSRIRASLPTLEYLLARDCKLVVCSHLGRPKGQVVEDMRLAPVSARLSELLGKAVAQAPDCVGPEVESAVAAIPAGGVLMLENLRFHVGEEKNDPAFAKGLASLADVYVNDAFGTAHRAHASTQGVTKYLPSVAGFLMARELEMLGMALDNPKRPLAAIMGGAKVSDKIAVLERLVDMADLILVGGGMAATFLKAQGHEIGDSLIEGERVGFASDLIARCRSGKPRLLLPSDVVMADRFAGDAEARTASVSEIPAGWRVLDIGPDTADAFGVALRSCRTVIWNGPMGVFEWPAFAQGTVSIANTLAAMNDAVTVVGGGSTAEAVEGLGLSGKMTHVSTGGGASLEFMEGRELPGVAALLDADSQKA